MTVRPSVLAALGIDAHELATDAILPDRDPYSPNNSVSYSFLNVECAMNFKRAMANKYPHCIVTMCNNGHEVVIRKKATT